MKRLPIALLSFTCFFSSSWGMDDVFDDDEERPPLPKNIQPYTLDNPPSAPKPRFLELDPDMSPLDLTSDDKLSEKA